jgi:hypothetical protein
MKGKTAGNAGRLLRVELLQSPEFLLLGKPIAAINSTDRHKPAARDDH